MLPVWKWHQRAAFGPFEKHPEADVCRDQVIDQRVVVRRFFCDFGRLDGIPAELCEEVQLVAMEPIFDDHAILEAIDVDASVDDAPPSGQEVTKELIVEYAGVGTREGPAGDDVVALGDEQIDGGGTVGKCLSERRPAATHARPTRRDEVATGSMETNEFWMDQLAPCRLVATLQYFGE